MRPSRYNYIWEKRNPWDKEALPSLSQEMDWPATFLCPTSQANSHTGWSRSILLCKIGSLVTPETWTILNSCELEHHFPPISRVPLKETKKKKKRKPLIWNDLRNSLTVSRNSESISIHGREPEVRAPTFWPSRSFRTRRKHSCSGVLTRFFFFKTKFSIVGLLFTMPPFTLIGFVEVDEGCYRLCLKCLKNAKIIMMVIIIEYLRMCQVLHRC